MVPTNDFLQFATAGGANVESQADYSVDAQRTAGQQPGVAKSALNNKALRQANYIASVLAQFLANTTGNNVLDDTNSANLLATMALAWPNGVVPTTTKFTITGATTGYLFTVTSANATVGATYTNNGNTYTVLATLASGTQLFCSGAGAPLSSGTLSKSTGTGDASITFSANQAMGTYTPPANVKYLRARVAAAGGGGGGANSSGSAGTGGTGLPSVFGPNLLIASGGGGGSNVAFGTGAGGLGGAASINTLVGLSVSGGEGALAPVAAVGDPNFGGSGGSNPLGGSGSGGNTSTFTGRPGAANSGAGGGGATSDVTGPAGYGGTGGGAGGFIDVIIPVVAASYCYAIGTGGVGGSGGTGTRTGGVGASGLIVIEEHYSG